MPPKKSKDANSCGSCGLFVFFSLFFIIGIGCLWGLALQPSLKLREANTWPEVACVVRQIGIEVHSSDDDTYSPEVAFEYSVDGRNYTGHQFWFGSGSSGDRKAIAEAIAPFQVGGEYPCYVNPQDPNEAVLTRQVASHAWVGWLIGGLFSAVGAIAMYATFRSYLGARRKAAARRSSSSLDAEVRPSLPALSRSLNREYPNDGQPHYEFDEAVCPVEQDGPDEPMPLATQGSRVGTAIGSWIFAAIWNGIAWTVGYFILRDFHIIAALFFSVFALVGVATVLFSIYSTLQIWNPQTTLVCSQRNLYPGSEFEISWLHQGKSSSISEFSIELEGQESATYRQGTTTRIDKSTFLKQSIVKTLDPSEISQGFRLVQLPEDTMHTMDSGHNAIAWQIRVHGKIRFWPDIHDVYAVTIFPPKIDGADDAAH